MPSLHSLGSFTLQSKSIRFTFWAWNRPFPRMLHCSSTSSYSQTSIFFTLLPVSGFLFFFFFSLRLRVTLPANFIIYLFSLPFFYSLIAKIIPLFHSSTLFSLVHVIGLLSILFYILCYQFCINNKNENSLDSIFRFPSILLLLFFRWTNQYVTIISFFNTFNVLG